MKTLWKLMALLIMVGGAAATMGCGEEATKAAPPKTDAPKAADAPKV
jgi:hypothetical protein